MANKFIMLNQSKNTVTTKIIGGLGNQMFQYAIARALALQNNSQLKLDISGFETYPHFSYGLQDFNIAGDCALEKETSRFHKYQNFLETKPWKISYKILRKLHIDKLEIDKKIFHSLGYIREYQRTYDPSVARLKGNLYLDGFWQTEKYFKDVAEIIRKDFTLKTAHEGEGHRFAEMIQSKEMPVCLHVRRGAYADNPVINRHHGVLPLEYYYAAIKKIVERVSNPHFFIFSDSIDWAKKNLEISHPCTYVGQGEGKSHEDLMLMSYCKHHILSNSTFGWWGAWLSSSNKNQVVVAPKKWVTRKSFDISDLIPESWIIMDYDLIIFT